MASDEAVLRAARNGFLVVIVALVALSFYQVVTFGMISLDVTLLWVVGVVTYATSVWYYWRTSDGDDEATVDPSGAEAGN